MTMIGIGLSVAINYMRGANSPAVSFSLSQDLRDLQSTGVTVGTFSSDSANTTYTLLDDASGQFTLGGNMLRLEKIMGTLGTTYDIQVRATAPGKSAATLDLTLTVIQDYTNGLVMRMNALDISKLWQDDAGTTAVTADGQAIGKLITPTGSWEWTQATSGARPLYKTNIQNGRAAISFDGTNDFLSCTTSAAISFFGSNWKNKEWTIIIIGSVTDVAANREMLCWGTGSVNNLISRISTGAGFNALIGTTGTTSSGSTTAGIVTNGAASIWSVSSNGGPDDVNLQFMQNGVYSYNSGNGDLEHEVGSSVTTGTLAPTTLYLGRRTTAASGFMKGYIFDILIYDRKIGRVEMEYIHKCLGQEWGITVTPSVTLLDKTGWSEWWTDDFDTDTTNQDPATDYNPTGWLWGLTSSGTGRNTYGSGGSIADEQQWNQDPRNAIWVDDITVDLSNSCWNVQSKATPAGLSSYANSLPYLSAAMISHFWKARTFGIVQFRMKMSEPQNGAFGAGWMMPESDRWPGEIDVQEQFGLHGASQHTSRVHTDPYYPVAGGATGKTSTGVSAVVDHVDVGYHEYTVKWDETGCEFYFDGRLTGKAPPVNGVRELSITNGSSGLTNGTYTLYGDNGVDSLGPCTASLTVSGGVATAVTITKSGRKFTTQPVWYTNSGMTTALNTTLPGVTLNANIGPDPDLPMQFFEPFYAIWNLALGSTQVGAGTLDPGVGYPTLSIDRVRWYKKDRATPAKITVGVDPTFDSTVSSRVTAIVNAYSSGGETLTTAKQNLIADFVRAMSAWELRFDTSNVPGVTKDWDTSKLSLWDACDLIYLPISTIRSNAKINWKSPGTGTLIENGSGIGFTAGRSMSLPGTAAVYLNSGVTATQYNNQDNGISVFMRGVPTNSTIGAIAGFNQYCHVTASSTAWDAKFGSTAVISGQKSKTIPLVEAFYSFTRGYRVAGHVFKDGECVYGGLFSGNDTNTVSGNFKIGSYDGSTAGAAFEWSFMSVGRRLHQDEHEKKNEIVRALLTGWGAL